MTPVRAISKFLGISLGYDPAEEAGRSTNRVLLVVMLLCVGLPFLFVLNRQAGNLSVGGMALPSVCLSKAMFDTDCPGCGMTRSFVALAHGQLRDALRWHHLGPLLYLYFILQIGIRGWALRQAEGRLPERSGKWVHYFGWFMIGALFANWLAGILLQCGNGS